MPTTRDGGDAGGALALVKLVVERRRIWVGAVRAHASRRGDVIHVDDSKAGGDVCGSSEVATRAATRAARTPLPIVDIFVKEDP